MKSIAILAFVLIVGTTSAMADPLLGTWQTNKRDDGSFGHVAFSRCDGGICGVLTRSYNGSDQQIATPIDGRRIIRGMKAAANSAYAGGKVWSPDRDKTYAAKLAIKDDRLTVKGCVLKICVTAGVWTRVND